MKCPYKNFEECILQECPACIYEVKVSKELEGICPNNLTVEEAIDIGYLYKVNKKEYIFKSCLLANNGVQPVLRSETNIHQNTNVSVSHSIF